MPGIALVGVSQAGGVIRDSPNTAWTWDGKPIAVIGATVTGHGKHSSPAMVTGSSWFTINGLGVVRAGDRASCGHTSDGIASVDIE